MHTYTCLLEYITVGRPCVLHILWMRSHEKKQIASPRCVPNLRVKSTVNTSALRSTWPGCTKKSWNCQCIFRASGNFYPKSPLSTSREEKNEKILSWLVKYWRNIAFFFFWEEEKAGNDLATLSCICAFGGTVTHLTRPWLLCVSYFDFVLPMSYFILSPKW